MDSLDKAIKEVREVREHDEAMLKLQNEADDERLAIAATFKYWLKSGEVNGILTEGDAMNLAAAFAVGWVSGREYNKKVKEAYFHYPPPATART